jgi:hypothetical protein
VFSSERFSCDGSMAARWLRPLILRSAVGNTILSLRVFRDFL